MPSPRLSLVSLAVLLGLGCKSTGPEPLTIDTSIPAAPVVATPKSAARGVEDPPPVAVYGYFRLPALDRTLPLISEQLLPPQQRGTFDATTVRAILQGQLPERSGVADEVDFSRPMGCLIVSPKQYDVPLVCALGYRGGLPRLVERLGSDGFLSGGEGYVAYRLDSRPVYFVSMGDHVAFAFAPELLADTGDQLRRDVIDAAVGPEDFVFTGYPSVVFADAHDEVLEVIDGIVANAKKPEDQPSQREQFLSYGELEQLDLWLELDGDADRTRLGYRGRALADTPTARAYAQQLGKGLDLPLLSELPANAILQSGMSLDTEAMLSDPMWGAMPQAQLGTAPGDAPSAMADLYRRNLAAWSELWRGRTVMALLHEPGTKGGVVVASRLVSSDDVLPTVRSLFNGMDDALASTGVEVRVELKKGAVRVGKVRGDRIEMTATTEAMRAGLTQLWGGPGLEVAYAQRGDVLYMALAPIKADRYLARVLRSPGRKGTLGGVARELLASHADDSLLITVSMAQVLAWMQAIGVIEPIAFETTARPDDVVLSMRSTSEREREMILDLSPEVLQTIYRLRGGG